MAEQKTICSMAVVPVEALQQVLNFIADHRGITTREGMPYVELLKVNGEGGAKTYEALIAKIMELEGKVLTLTESIEKTKAPPAP